METIVRTPGSKFDINRQIIVVRIKKVEGALQVLVPMSLKGLVLQHSRNQFLSGRTGALRMYDTGGCEYYWIQMGNDLHQVVKNLRSCAMAKGIVY